MALKIFGFHDRPHDFAVSKANDVELGDCVFFLDFSRPLERLRWLGRYNRWIGFTVGLSVPIVHVGERSGGYVFTVNRGEPYFVEIQDLWKKHRGATRTIGGSPVEPLQLIADFGRHFPDNC